MYVNLHTLYVRCHTFDVGCAPLYKIDEYVYNYYYSSDSIFTYFHAVSLPVTEEFLCQDNITAQFTVQGKHDAAEAPIQTQSC